MCVHQYNVVAQLNQDLLQNLYRCKCGWSQVVGGVACVWWAIKQPNVHVNNK